MTIVNNMSTMRWQNWPILKANFEEMRLNAPHVQYFWQPVILESEAAKFPQEVMELLREPWIQLVVLPDKCGLGVDVCNYKVNAGIEKLIGGDLFVWLGSDDNIYPVDCLKVFAERVGNKRVIVCSHKRGQRTTFHGHSDLVADPKNVFPSYISGEQYLVHASIMEHFRYDPSKGIASDGYMIHAIHKKHYDQFAFLPDYFIPFNAMEPGRWDEGPLRECTKSKSVDMIYARKPV